MGASCGGCLVEHLSANKESPPFVSLHFSFVSFDFYFFLLFMIPSLRTIDLAMNMEKFKEIYLDDAFLLSLFVNGICSYRVVQLL